MPDQSSGWTECRENSRESINLVEEFSDRDSVLSGVQLNSVIPASKWPRIDLWVAALAKSVGNSQNAHALGERGYKLSSAIPLWQTCKKDLFR